MHNFETNQKSVGKYTTIVRGCIPVASDNNYIVKGVLLIVLWHW